MDKVNLQCYCCRSASRCVYCQPKKSLGLDAALHELGVLSGATSEQTNILREKRERQKESRAWIEQSPPLWINSTSSTSLFNQTLRVDTECTKETPQQPPNSPVSPQLPFDHFRVRDSLNDPLPQRCEWEGRLLGGRRVGMKGGRQRVLSGPAVNDKYSDRTRECNNWRPYRIPRPKLLSNGHCPRVRTVSATLHEETDRLEPAAEPSQVSITADALQCMAIGESANRPTEHLDSHLCFPRSRSMENLQRRAMDVASTVLDSVSEKIEKLHVV